VTFANGYDRLDHFILSTVQEWQKRMRTIMASPLIDEVFGSDANRAPNGFPICETKSEIETRLRYLSEQGFLRISGSGVVGRDSHFTFAVMLTGAGDAALLRGPKFREAASQMGNNNNVTIGSLVANQVAVGDNARQNSTVNLSITLGELLDNLEQAIEESDQPAEVKAEAKSGLQKFRENVATSAGLATMTNFAINHLPTFTGWLGRL